MRLLPLLAFIAVPALADPPPAKPVWGKANEANLRAMARLLAGKPKALLRENTSPAGGPAAGAAPR